MQTRCVKFILLIFVLLAPLAPVEVRGFSELSDQALCAVRAGNADATFDSVEALTRVPFRYSGSNGDVYGEVFVLPMTDIRNRGSLRLMDNAQSNLRSLINVNAVNSPVQVLLNLNININSRIGNVNQLNNLLSSQGARR